MKNKLDLLKEIYERPFKAEVVIYKDEILVLNDLAMTVEQFNELKQGMAKEEVI